MKNTQEELLKAAAAVFAQKGFQNANVADICRKANANIASINYHFGGKKKLYLKVLDYASDLADQEFPLFLDATAVPNPQDRLIAFILGHFRRVSFDNPSGFFSRILVHEMTNPSFAHHLIMQKNISRMREYLDALLREILPAGIPDSFVWVCHFNIVSLFTFPMIMRAVHHPRMKNKSLSPPEPEEMAKSAALFAAGGISAIIQAFEEGVEPPAIFPPPIHEPSFKGRK